MTAAVATVCQDIFERVPQALACAVVDLTTGLLIASRSDSARHPPGFLDVLAAAAVDLVRGRTVRRLEDILASAGGKPVRDTVEEVFLAAFGAHHYLKVLKEKQAVLVLVTPPTTNQGLGWSVVRGSLAEVAAAL
jgi:hypothetical protein